MKKYLIIIFLGVVSALHAGTYAVMDSTIIEDANGQVVQKQYYDYSPSNMTISRYYLYEGAWVINQTYYSYYHEEESAIENVGMDAKFDESRPSYDTQGRRINPAEYHGVIIQDGHKFLR